MFPVPSKHIDDQHTHLATKKEVVPVEMNDSRTGFKDLQDIFLCFLPSFSKVAGVAIQKETFGGCNVSEVFHSMDNGIGIQNGLRKED